MALAYGNTYRVGMWSLSLPRVYELVRAQPGWMCERFFSDGEEVPGSVERGTPLEVFGCIGCIGFEVSFEDDYVNLLRIRVRARIPGRRDRVMPSVEHVTALYANNRCDASHQPARQREPQMASRRRPPGAWSIVEARLKQDWSPEQIAGRLSLSGVLSISHETIYRHIWENRRSGGLLYNHLRGSRKARSTGTRARGRQHCSGDIDSRLGLPASR